MTSEEAHNKAKEIMDKFTRKGPGGDINAKFDNEHESHIAIALMDACLLGFQECIKIVNAR